MALAIVEIDLATYEAIKDNLKKLEAFKAKWPKDYHERCGYRSIMDRIADLCKYAFPAGR